jgi:hypothetical protein
VVRIPGKLQTGRGNDSASHTVGKAAKSEDFLIEQSVALEAHKTKAVALVIPKEAVDMMVGGFHPIRAFRVHRRMTQLQLCAAAKIVQKQLSEFENARVVSKEMILKKLALALTVPQDLLTLIK